VNGAYYCGVWLLKQLLPDICQTAGDFCFQRTRRRRVQQQLSCCDTRLRTSHQNVASQQIRSQSCRLGQHDMDSHPGMRNLKQQGMSNIVDELCLLTE